MDMVSVIILIIGATIVATTLVCVIGDTIKEHAKAKYGYQTYKKLRDEESPATWKSEVRDVPITDIRDVEPGCR